MTKMNCSCNTGCTVLAVIASVAIGVITSLLRITAVITVGNAFLWTLFGIAVVYLAVTFLKADTLAKPSRESCICPGLSTLIVGILGTILASVVLLAIEFAATSIIGAIITGALTLFFSLIVTSTACLIKCVSRCNDDVI